MTKARNTRTVADDAQTGIATSAPASPVAAYADRSGLGLEFDAFMTTFAASLAPLAQQVARLEKADEIRKANGWSGTDRNGEVYTTRQLNSLRSSIGMACRILKSYAYGSERYPDGTKQQADMAGVRFEELALRDPEHYAMDKLGFEKMLGEHAHFNVGRAIAAMADQLHEALLGGPLVVDEAKPKAAKPKVDTAF